MEKSIFQHYRKEEQPFIEKVINELENVTKTYSYHLTSFVDPRQVAIYQALARQQGLQFFSSNDYVTTEYARVIIAPDYYVFDVKDFELTLFEVKYATKFNHLNHGQVMGTLINQLGIKRSVFGDVLVNGNRIQVFVDDRLSTYFQNEIKKIGRVPVVLEIVSFSQLIEKEQQLSEQIILVSSLRLDKVVATVLKISRSKAVQLILADKVKLNYRIISKPSEPLVIGDMLSVRGFGRITLSEGLGFSKSEKQKIRIEKTVKS